MLLIYTCDMPIIKHYTAIIRFVERLENKAGIIVLKLIN